MKDDDELCLCFHVTKRKVINFIRVEKPLHASQLSECYGAGTGCGWCRPYLRKLFEQLATGQQSNDQDLPASDEYGRGRQKYVDDGHGKPPSPSS